MSSADEDFARFRRIARGCQLEDISWLFVADIFLGVYRDNAALGQRVWLPQIDSASSLASARCVSLHLATRAWRRVTPFFFHVHPSSLVKHIYITSMYTFYRVAVSRDKFSRSRYIITMDSSDSREPPYRPGDVTQSVIN